MMVDGAEEDQLKGPIDFLAPYSCLCAPGALGWWQRAVGVYFTLETVQERGAGRLGRFSGVMLGVEAVGSQAGAKGSLCRGQPPSIMHSIDGNMSNRRRHGDPDEGR